MTRRTDQPGRLSPSDVPIRLMRSDDDKLIPIDHMGRVLPCVSSVLDSRVDSLSLVTLTLYVDGALVRWVDPQEGLS